MESLNIVSSSERSTWTPETKEDFKTTSQESVEKVVHSVLYGVVRKLSQKKVDFSSKNRMYEIPNRNEIEDLIPFLWYSNAEYYRFADDSDDLEVEDPLVSEKKRKTMGRSETCQNLTNLGQAEKSEDEQLIDDWMEFRGFGG